MIMVCYNKKYHQGLETMLKKAIQTGRVTPGEVALQIQSVKQEMAQMKVIYEMERQLKQKYAFITESKKLLDKLPQNMRYVGKPEVLSDTFLETKLGNSDEGFRQGNSITNE